MTADLAADAKEWAAHFAQDVFHNHCRRDYNHNHSNYNRHKYDGYNCQG